MSSADIQKLATDITFSTTSLSLTSFSLKRNDAFSTSQLWRYGSTVSTWFLVLTIKF